MFNNPYHKTHDKKKKSKKSKNSGMLGLNGGDISLSLNKSSTNKRKLPRVGDKVKVRKRTGTFEIERVDSLRGVAEATSPRGAVIEIYDDGRKLTADLRRQDGGREDLGKARVVERTGMSQRNWINNALNG